MLLLLICRCLQMFRFTESRRKNWDCHTSNPGGFTTKTISNGENMRMLKLQGLALMLTLKLKLAGGHLDPVPCVLLMF